MKKLFFALPGLVAALSLLCLGTGGQVSAHSLSTATTRPIQVCGAVAMGLARCTAIQMLNLRFHPDAGGPAGYHPADLQSAYNLPSNSAGSGQIVAVIDAFDDPSAASDLATYRSTFGLPACGKGCFKKVNEQGQTKHYPGGS